jgi:hypothetical protein
MGGVLCCSWCFEVVTEFRFGDGRNWLRSVQVTVNVGEVCL